MRKSWNANKKTTKNRVAPKKGGTNEVIKYRWANVNTICQTSDCRCILPCLKELFQWRDNMSLTISIINKNKSSLSELYLTAALVESKKKSVLFPHWLPVWKRNFEKTHASQHFKASQGEMFFFVLPDGSRVLALGMGEKSQYTGETLRRQIAQAYKSICNQTGKLSINLDSFQFKNKQDATLACIVESLGMAAYRFEKYKKNDSPPILKQVELTTSKMDRGTSLRTVLKNTEKIVESINFCRNLVNEPPNALHSESYAKIIQQDASKLTKVRIKILGKGDLKREKMGMFLSVNAGSAHEPRLVQLTYSPGRTDKKTKHIALVGKGLTFDTGGYSLKPSGSMANMKFDMAGSATVYAAFRAAALLKLKVKVSCFLGMTDNAVNEHATMPDSIVTARNGKRVEILNTDAEGRLVLGDVINYACDQKPDAIIDAATLTGAVLISLGNEICGLMSNNDTLAKDIKQAADQSDEYLWRLPIIDEFKSDLKSPIADLKNIGNSRFAGTAKAAAFLQHFLKNDIPWAHLDIAGVADAQSHLNYCPPKGASGLMVRTLVNYMASL